MALEEQEEEEEEGAAVATAAVEDEAVSIAFINPLISLRVEMALEFR
jgi:hypothetical protein